MISPIDKAAVFLGKAAAVVVQLLVLEVIVVLLVSGLFGLSLGAFAPLNAFGQKNDNRPPKDPGKVKTPDKEPRGNSNSSSNRNKH